MRISLLAVGLAAGCLFATTAAQAETLHFVAVMDGAHEVPAHATPGKGEADITLDTFTKQATINVVYSGLTGPATMAHIHGPADVGANAGIMVPLTPVTSPIKMTVTLTDEQVAAMRAGKEYVNVHTAANPGGEIRGQIVPGGTARAVTPSNSR